MMLCPRCGEWVRKIRVEQHARRHAKLDALINGIHIVRDGGTYDEAAKVAGYHSGYTFSRACVVYFGARPLALAKETT